ncbi:MAG: substrate-binding domain-containing protein [Akkermansiaceae bacterium]|nr:substrate-binding domain-containing protein [Akkermansiaceae bacterium]
MKPFHAKTASEQLADHLREELLRGRWTGTMPGQHQLLTELGTGMETIRSALEILQKQGYLKAQGKGKRRLITIPEEAQITSLKVRVLPYDEENKIAPFVLDFVRMAHDDGHQVEIQGKTLYDLKMNADKVSRYVSRFPADAWVVVSGKGEVLKWFSEQDFPTFALFGRIRDIEIASVNVRPYEAISEFVNRLLDQGHRRIVWMVRGERRKPRPGALEQHFLDLLESRGIEVGSYHLPEWDESREGLERCLDQLFRFSPPTAIIVTEAQLYLAVQNSVNRRGMRVPEDLSMVCMDVFENDPSLDWITPQVSHYRWHWQPVSRRMMKWLHNVAIGKKDLAQTFLEAEYVEGETIGPVPDPGSAS